MCVIGAGNNGGADTTMVDLVGAEDGGGADATMYGDVDTIEGMDVEDVKDGGGAVAEGYGDVETNVVVVSEDDEDGGGADTTMYEDIETNEVVVLESALDRGGADTPVYGSTETNEVIVLESALDGGGADTTVYGATETKEVNVLESEPDGGGANTTVYGATETKEVMCMDVVHDGGRFDDQMEWYAGGAPDDKNVMVVEDSTMSEHWDNEPKGSIKNYFCNDYTRRNTNDLQPRNGTFLGGSSGNAVEAKSTMRKTTRMSLTTGRVKKNASKGAKSRTWDKKLKKKLMGDQVSGSSQPGIRGFFCKQDKLGIIGLEFGIVRKNSHGI